MTSPRKLGPPTLISSVLVLCLLVASPQSLAAQSPGGSQDPPAQQEGVTSGDYVIHTSAEIGYRYTNVTGSEDMYDTLVNLQTGLRFLDETFSMQSQDHQGLLFDNLSVNSFGWGGDPNNVLRARVEKNKWYNFLASFRRDQNFFDYDLLVNPLNPPTSSPSIPVLNSAHAFDTTRRMTDIDLTLLPPICCELSIRIFAQQYDRAFLHQHPHWNRRPAPATVEHHHERLPYWHGL